ncbi:MAG: zinc ribbon domain-containing protein [Firmicutes bacterium]|nr:zinc ribbon domain-containing protein [Bacillota bacterium]
MALIICPECKKQISDRAESCPHCGLPAKFFVMQNTVEAGDIDYNNLANIVISFDADYAKLFSKSHYISHMIDY